jgi:uncharacterized protein DUF4262
MEHQDFLRHMATIADQIEARRTSRPDGLGWTVQHVRHSDPRKQPYSYTVGLSVYHRPELVAYSLQEPGRQVLLNMVAAQVLTGPPRAAPIDLVLTARLRCRVRPHPHPQRLRAARAYIEGLDGYHLRAWVVEPATI